MKVLLIHSGNALGKSSTSVFVKEQGNALERAGVEVSYYYVIGKGAKGYLDNLKDLKNKIDEERPDIIHAHYGLCGALAVLQRKVPVIITFHNGETLTKKGILFSSFASQLSAYNIFVAEHIKKGLFAPKRRYSIIPCGVNLDQLPNYTRSEAKNFLGFDNNETYVLFGGAFDNPRKNAALAKEAISLVNKPVTLIEMKGWNREQVPFLYAACDLLLLPSKSEGSPQVVKEAMACNCPVVATNVADISWLLKDVTSSYVTSFDAKEISERINAIIESNERSNGRKRIMSLGLDNDTIACKLLSIYKAVLKR